jgi:hypothetical protein
MTSWTRAALASLAALVIGCGGKPAPDQAATPQATSPAATTPAQAPPPAAPPSPTAGQPATVAPPDTPPGTPPGTLPGTPPGTPPGAPTAAAAAIPNPAASPGGAADAGEPPIMAVSPVVAGEPTPALPMVSRETLEKAYKEIYCAQRKGEADKLITIFERYGFRDPRSWTVAWTDAVKDQQWVARITQQAMADCP